MSSIEVKKMRAKPISDIPDDGLSTPYGHLYKPLSEGRQILVLVAVFFAGPMFGWLMGQALGDLSQTAQTLICVPFVLVFFMGYALWVARLQTLAFDTIGRSLLKVLFLVIIKRRRPDSLDDVLPTREKLLEMAVRAQKAGQSFASVSWPIGMGAGFAAMLFDSAMSATALFVVVAASTIIWGYLLARLGRRGWLPFMEQS